MRKIVILDHPRENPGEIDWSGYEKYGEVTRYAGTSPDEIVSRAAGAEVVFLNKTVLTAETINALPDLRFLSVIATGYNTVDVKAAAARGIPVANVPSYGSEAIAQHAVALLLEITDHVAHHDAEVRKGRRTSDRDWCFWDYPSIELENKTCGIIGLGRLGKLTARMVQAFGMKVLAYDSFPDLSLETETLRYTDLDTLLASSDVVFLHCPLLPETGNILSREAIAKMKKGAILINNSRGGLVDEDALAEALNDGRLYAAGLDAVKNEPISSDSPLLTAKNCFITPHISWAALDCRQRLIDYALDNLRAWLDGKPTNIVNGV